MATRSTFLINSGPQTSANKLHREEQVTEASRRYSRSELFRLARQVGVAAEGAASESVSAYLDQLENANWRDYHLDLIDQAGYSSPAAGGGPTRFGFGRQLSELGQESLTRYHSQQQPTQTTLVGSRPGRLTRMTSSPSIRHHAGRKQTDGSLRQNYSRLIDKMTLNNSANNSDREPISLQYSAGASNNWRHQITTSNSLIGGAGDEGGVAEISAPIRRIGAPDNAQESQPLVRCDTMDEDQFDIASLVSITVLSDIKTIRQDVQQQQPTTPATVGSCATNAKPPTRTRVGHNKQTPVKQVLTRALTSTEFNYKNKRSVVSRQPGYGLDDYLSMGPHYSQDEQSEPYSLGCFPTGPPTWTAWSASQADLRDGRSDGQVLERQIKQTTTVDQPPKPKDEKVAQIIEEFKAQVKARAQLKLDESTILAPMRATNTPDGAKTLSTPAEFNGSQSRTGEKAVKSGETGRLVAADPTSARDLIDGRSESKPRSEENCKLDEERDKENASRVCKSNIPRLISLHPAAREPPPGRPAAASGKPPTAIKVAGKPTETRPATRTLTSSASTANSSTRTGATVARPSSAGKFVSQYRLLRGRSLADELEESK